MSKKTSDDNKSNPLISLRAKQVDLTVKEIQEKYGEGSIMRLGEVRKVNIDAIPTGSISLDLAAAMPDLSNLKRR